jgi:hypothetical protein
MAREVVLYTRAGCGLCDEAGVMLRALSGELRFTVREVDIDRDPGAPADYDDAIPVIAVGGRVVSRAPVDQEALREGLAAALASSQQSAVSSQ